MIWEVYKVWSIPVALGRVPVSSCGWVLSSVSHEVCIVRVCLAYTATQGGQTRESGPLELQLQVVGKCPAGVLGTAPRSSARTVSTHNC